MPQNTNTRLFQPGEAARLKIVRQFDKLNLQYNQQLHYMVKCAARIFQTPLASITLIDDDVQWIRVRKGFDTEQTPRSLSFCTHAIKQNRLFIIRDTLQHPRFSDNPFTEGLKVRFYAGAPLITQDGYRIGTICVMDKKPRNPTPEQKLMLKVLSQSVISVMELKLSMNHLSEGITDLREIRKNKTQNELKLRSMFESLTDAYFLLGKHGEILDFNHVAYLSIDRFYNVKLSVGRIMAGFLDSDYREAFSSYYQRALLGEHVQLEQLSDFGTGKKLWWDIRFSPFTNNQDEVIGVTYLMRDIDERKLSEIRVIEQNQSLLRIAEIQSHDYRGPVASILGLMALIKNDGYVASKEYLLLLHTATEKLDEKIHEVVELVNTVADKL